MLNSCCGFWTSCRSATEDLLLLRAACWVYALVVEFARAGWLPPGLRHCCIGLAGMRDRNLLCTGCKAGSWALGCEANPVLEANVLGVSITWQTLSAGRRSRDGRRPPYCG